jgi:hypothetical protein
MNVYHLLADIVVAAHTAYVAFVIFGLLAVLVGRLLRWKWVRNFWFRLVHLLMITLVVVQSVLGIVCPLTTLEKNLLLQAGLDPYSRSFIGECLHNLLFIDAESWMFTVSYCLFGAVVLAAFFLVPPRWPKSKRHAELKTSGGPGAAE